MKNNRVLNNIIHLKTIEQSIILCNEKWLDNNIIQLKTIEKSIILYNEKQKVGNNII